MSGHRATPSPPFSDAPMGTCRWCGEAIVHGRVGARRWHDGRENERGCVVEYRQTWPSAWRRAVLERDGGVCAECPPGAAPGPREADHIVPLIDGGDWSLANGQTLCAEHHAAKTARENSERAARKRNGSAQAEPAPNPADPEARPVGDETL